MTVRRLRETTLDAVAIALRAVLAEGERKRRDRPVGISTSNMLARLVEANRSAPNALDALISL